MSALTPSYLGDSNRTAQIAMELAIKMLPVSEILTRFNLSANQLKLMLKDAAFKSMVLQFRTDWEAAENVRERVRLKSGVALEDSIPQLYTIAHDADTTPAARIDAIKQLAALADAVPRKDSNETASRFSVTINLPSGEPVQIEAPAAIEGEFYDED